MQKRGLIKHVSEGEGAQLEHRGLQEPFKLQVHDASFTADPIPLPLSVITGLIANLRYWTFYGSRMIVDQATGGGSRLNLYRGVKADPEPAHTIGSTTQERNENW